MEKIKEQQDKLWKMFISMTESLMAIQKELWKIDDKIKEL